MNEGWICWLDTEMCYYLFINAICWQIWQNTRLMQVVAVLHKTIVIQYNIRHVYIQYADWTENPLESQYRFAFKQTGIRYQSKINIEQNSTTIGEGDWEKSTLFPMHSLILFCSELRCYPSRVLTIVVAIQNVIAVTIYIYTCIYHFTC